MWLIYNKLNALVTICIPSFLSHPDRLFFLHIVKFTFCGVQFYQFQQMHKAVLWTIVLYKIIPSPKSSLCCSFIDKPAAAPKALNYSSVLSPRILPFPECHVNRIKQFWIWVLLFYKMQVRFTHVALQINSSFYCISSSFLLHRCTMIGRISRLFPIFKAAMRIY